MSEACDNNDFVHQSGLSLKDVAERYTEWANEYEKDLCEENYRGPCITAKRAQELYPDVEARANIRIIDVAAGTGFVAEKLHPSGFQNIDALEPSEGMMDILKEKNLYKNIYLEFINDNKLPIEPNTYDMVIIAGGMGEGHIPCNGLNELARITKKGGYVVIAMREAYLQIVKEYKDRLEPYMDGMEQQGLWTLVQRKVIPRYSFRNNGVLYTFKIK